MPTHSFIQTENCHNTTYCSICHETNGAKDKKRCQRTLSFKRQAATIRFYKLFNSSFLAFSDKMIASKRRVQKGKQPIQQQQKQSPLDSGIDEQATATVDSSSDDHSTANSKAVDDLFDSPRSSLRTNKNGLPLVTQRALLLNVLEFRGNDDFARDTCDRTPVLFGSRNSTKRKACQDKRRQLLHIYVNNPAEFLELCKCFSVTTVDPTLSAFLTDRIDIASPSEPHNRRLSSETNNISPIITKKTSVKTTPSKVKALFQRGKMPRHSFLGKFRYLFLDVCIHYPCILTFISFHLFTDSEHNIREFDLNLTDVEDNVNGFSGYISPAFEYGNEMIEAVVLHKQVLDIEDIMDHNRKIVLTLLDCGKKVLVEEPAVPHYFHTHSEQMFLGVQNPEVKRAIKTAHVYKMNDILNNPERLMKKYILNLPEGVTCKMGYMNPSNGRILVGSMNVAEKTLPTSFTKAKNDMIFTMATITYVVALDADEQKIIRSDPAIGNEAADFFARMCNLR